MSILIFLEHDADGIKDGSLAAVTAAKSIGGDITAIVVGEGADAAADAAAKIDGISAVVKAGDAKDVGWLLGKDSEVVDLETPTKLPNPTGDPRRFPTAWWSFILILA